MPINLACPGCGGQFILADSVAGKQVRCGACKQVFTAPAANAAPATPEEPAMALEAADEPTPAAAQIMATPPPAVPKELFGSPNSAEPPPLPPSRRRHPGDDDLLRRPRRKSGGIAVGVLLIGGGLLAVIAVVACFGVGGVYWLVQTRHAHDAQVAKEEGAAELKQKPRAKDDRAVDDKPPAKDFNPFVPGDPRFDPNDERPFFKEILPFIEKDFGDQQPKPAPEKTGKMPALPAPLPIKPAKLDGDVVTRTLPSTIGTVVLGGGGRFLILHLPKERQIAVFDANDARVVKYLPVAADNVLIAAGMTRMIVVYPETKLLQRWNLLNFERELTAPLPINDPISGIGMGYGSDGPLVVQTVREPISGDDHFVDIQSMKLIDLPVKTMGHVHRGANAHMRGSLDGRAFGITSGGAHAHLMTIEGGVAKVRAALDSGVIPGPDGKHVFGMGLFDAEVTRLASSPADGTFCVPALQGPFYLAIPAGTFHPGIPGQKKSGGVELRIFGDSRPLLPLAAVDNAVRDAFSNPQGGLTIDQRYHFIPDAQLLVTIPETRDRLVLRKLDLDAALEKSGIDYLFVTSRPAPAVAPGKEFSYHVAAKSKKGGLNYKLEAGPDGMQMKAGGVVHWNVPAGFPSGEVSVIITVSDSTGQEVFHTFKLRVGEAAQPKN